MSEPHVIGQIGDVIESLEGLNDCLLSAFLRYLQLEDGGFRPVGIENDLVVFAVPAQDSGGWYSDERPSHLMLSDEKRVIAKSIGKQFGLEFYEPPDRQPGFVSSRPRRIRHHFEFCRSGTVSTLSELVAVVHPRYLKTIWKGGADRIDPARLFQALKSFYD